MFLEFCGQKAATVKYKIKDLGNKDSDSTWIGCQIYGTTNTGDERESDLGKKAPKFEIKIKINITKHIAFPLKTLLKMMVVWV